MIWAPEGISGRGDDRLEKLIADVLVLGYSLQRHGSEEDRVLLATRDILRAPSAGMLHLSLIHI